MQIQIPAPVPGAACASAINCQGFCAPAMPNLRMRGVERSDRDHSLRMACRFVGTWPQDYHDRVEANLAQVAVTASTAGDQDALGLLRNEFSKRVTVGQRIVSARQSMNATNTVNPNYMPEHPGLRKITSCNGFLSSMLVSGVLFR